jgi:hypothetical protein
MGRARQQRPYGLKIFGRSKRRPLRLMAKCKNRVTLAQQYQLPCVLKAGNFPLNLE